MVATCYTQKKAQGYYAIVEQNNYLERNSELKPFLSGLFLVYCEYDVAFSVIGYFELKKRSFPHSISPLDGFDEFCLKRFRSAYGFVMVKKRVNNLLQ